MVAVRSTGLGLDSVIGHLDPSGAPICVVSRGYLEGLLAVANERFKENSARIARFRDLLLASNNSGKKGKGEEWEDASVRRERKRAEGLKRSGELRQKAADRTIIESDDKNN
jgi:tRNA wybutosine-synthesizing protein 3